MTDERWYLCIPYSAPMLTFDEPLVVGEAGYEVRFEPTRSSGHSRISVNDLSSVGDAQAVFAAVQRAAVAASLNLSTGIRIKDDLTILHSDEDPFPRGGDQPFACRQGRSLARLHLYVGGSIFQVGKIEETLRESIKVGFQHAGVEQSLRDRQVALACRLYVDIHFEASAEARFLGLIGVLEVLKDRDSVSDEALTLIERWRRECVQLGAAERDSFRGLLNYMKSISIGRGIRAVVERHLGPQKAQEAQHLYNLRSSLVHDGKRPEGLDADVRQAEIIVRELLVSILTANQELDTDGP